MWNNQKTSCITAFNAVICTHGYSATAQTAPRVIRGKEIKMDLKNELKQLEHYYEICAYNGKLKAESLIHGINCILEGEERTVDIHDSTREELEERISKFYMNIDEYLTN